MASADVRPAGAARPPLRRDPSRRMLGGVSSGTAAWLGIDPLLVRTGFVVAALAGGLGVVLYALGWVAIPRGETDSRAAPRLRMGHGGLEVALGTGLLLLSVLLAFRELGLWFSDAIVWPLVLVAAGGALLWRQSTTSPGIPDERATRESGWSTGQPSRAGAASAASVATPRAQAPVAQGSAPPAAAGRRGAAFGPDTVRDRAAVISRTGLGVALVTAAGLVFLQATGSLSAARDAIAAVVVVVVVLGVIFAPWIVRLWRSLSRERAERIRSQERAEMAAHIHDSVLQTLAMVQKRADSSREVASLARRQERELRSWLSERSAGAGEAGRLAAALDDVAQEVEIERGVQVEVVTVGDRALDPPAEALVAAAREAIVNAAKFAGDAPVAVYAEASHAGAQVFVRDRGPGFDPQAIPLDRRGVRESIVGRMERNGGTARVTSSPGRGTEVELRLGRSAP